MYLLKHACLILKVSNSRIFCNTCVNFQWKKTNSSRHIGILSALRKRGLHDKRQLLAKLRIAGSENCFRIDSLSSNLRDKTTHLSMQHCFHVAFYIIGTQYLHIRHPGKDILQNLYLTVIFQIIIKCEAHAQNSKSLFIYISAVSESMLLR